MLYFNQPYYTINEAASLLSRIMGVNVTSKDIRRLSRYERLEVIEIDPVSYPILKDTDNEHQDDMSDITKAGLMARMIRITRPADRAKPLKKYHLVKVIHYSSIESYVQNIPEILSKDRTPWRPKY